jgi:hypothetical protein
MCVCVSELQAKHELKMQALRDELELRRKTEIHEIEEVAIDVRSIVDLIVLLSFLYLYALFSLYSISLSSPCVRACAAGVKHSVCVSVVCCLSSVVRTKITRSRHLGTSAIRKHNESLEIVDKLASLCFKSLGKAHKRRKYGVLLGTPINHIPMCLVHIN